MPVTPFVVGQWVRGEKFYGRNLLIEEILRGPRNWVWLLGTRRIGKTSLLKQIEYLTTTTPDLRYFPVFWDFQGASDPDELHMGFSDALLDAEDRLAELGIEPGDVEDDNLFRSLGRLRRRIRAKGFKLMLLCDEVEELIKLNQKDPSLLSKLRRVLQSYEDIRSVLASTIRLWALADQRGDTSPFLHGFSPPLYIHTLSDRAAEALIRQANLPSDSRPMFNDEAVEFLRGHCDNHPYLIQLAAKRFAELGNLQEAVDQVAADPMVSYFFSVDFEMLTDTERDILRVIAENSSSTSKSIQDNVIVDTNSLSGLLYRLEHLGYIRKNEEQRYVLMNYFFRRWFKDLPTSGGPVSDKASAETISDTGTNATTETAGNAGLFGDRYEVVKQVGKGATGVVYKARDRQLKVDIAIKLLRHEYASNPEALERFRQEIVFSRDVVHPNILRIYDLGQTGDRRYLTMQWVEGPTLAQMITDRGAFSHARTVTVARKIASAVEALHAAKVLHRDIKPQNILMDEGGEPYLTDFGLVRLLGRTGMTRSGVFLGTPDYASPEQAKLLPLDDKSDIYSLGLVIFEMATGQKPFRGKSSREVLEMHKNSPPPAPVSLRPVLPADLSNLILRCLEKEPQRRYSSAADLRMALENL